MEPLMHEHLEGGVNYSVPGGAEYLVFEAQNIHLTSHTDFSSCIDYLKDWQAAGTFTLKVIRDTSTNHAEWDGDNTSFTVVLKSRIKGMEKMAPGDDDNWMINSLLFEEG